jgi:hypothetical protein
VQRDIPFEKRFNKYQIWKGEFSLVHGEGKGECSAVPEAAVLMNKRHRTSFTIFNMVDWLRTNCVLILVMKRLGLGVLIFILVTGVCLASRALTIITVINGENPLYGYTETAPAYDVAFQRTMRIFPNTFANVSRFTLYTPGVFSCPDAAVLMSLISDKIHQMSLKHSDDFCVIFSSGKKYPIWKIKKKSIKRSTITAHTFNLCFSQAAVWKLLHWVISPEVSTIASLTTAVRSAFDFWIWLPQTQDCTRLLKLIDGQPEVCHPYKLAIGQGTA